MNAQDNAGTAATLVQARRTSTGLTRFPGEIPSSVDDSYQVQDKAIELWGDHVAGWKVGLIAPGWRERAGAVRLVGPIFQERLWSSEPGTVTLLPVISGGTACVEAEIVLTVGKDIPLGVADWSAQDALRHLGGAHVAVELAGSPVPEINALGPMAVASDFGNNAGLVLGPSVPDWQSGAWERLVCTTWVDDEVVGCADPSTIPGGALEAFRFALATCSARGRQLRAGDHIATGAVTGIHDVVAGQRARVQFGELYQFDLEVVEA